MSRSSRWLRSVPSLKRNMRTASSCGEHFNPYKYTSGRWLRLDERQRQARHVDFDFDKLCAKAIACSSGAREIVQCVKMEGGFNRAFMLQLDNGKSLVARIPFSIAGPARIVTNSEVATMEYVRKHTSIPVPMILDWSDSSSNPIGTEYIIMESASGVQLQQKWPSMSSHEHVLAVKALALMAKEMSLLQFSAYGSIYFADAPVDKSILIRISEEFCIGPHCGKRYWPGTPGEERFYERRPPNRGPWNTHEDYCHGLVDAGISRIPPTTPTDVMESQGTVDEHLYLADVAEKVLLRLVQTSSMQSVERPMLLHRDLHKRNVFVSDEDPSKITCLIDWQSSSIEPVHYYSDETPDLCDFPYLWNENEVEDPPSEAQQKAINDVSICNRTWEVSLSGYIPELYKARTMAEDVLRLFRYAPSAWKHSAVSSREDLVQLSKNWSSELSLHGPCPYQPTEDEIERQKTLWEEFRTIHDFKSELIRGLGADEDGWVPIDRWQDTQEAHALLCRKWLDTVVKSGESTEDEARKVWPFDVV